MSLTKIDSKIETPKVRNDLDTLNIVRSGRIEYACRSVTLDSTYLGHVLTLIIPHGYEEVGDSLGLALLVNRCESITGTVDGESVSSYSNIVPWDGGGIYYNDGTNEVYYARNVWMGQDYLFVQFIRYLTAGTHTTASFSNAHLNWMLVNSKQNPITNAVGGGLGVFPSGYKYYYDTIVYNSDMEIESEYPLEGEDGFKDYNDDYYKTPFLAVNW